MGIIYLILIESEKKQLSDSILYDAVIGQA